MPPADPLTLLCLGDSYTIGEGVSVAERWPSLLAGRLRRADRDVADPVVIARTGWTAAELLAAVGNLPGSGFDLVTLMVGVNDQYRGLPEDGYRSALQSLVDIAIRAARGQRGRVLVVSIPDWGVSPYAAGRDRAAIGDEIDRFNRVALDVAAKGGLATVDVTSSSRKHRHAADFAADGLHPSARLHEVWAGEVAMAAGRVLRTTGSGEVDSVAADGLP